MANDISGNPIIVDTPSASVIWQGNIYINQIEFNYNADTDTVTVKNRNGRILWKGNGESDITPVRSGALGWVEGLIVDQLTAGNILIYVK